MAFIGNMHAIDNKSNDADRLTSETPLGAKKEKTNTHSICNRIKYPLITDIIMSFYSWLLWHGITWKAPIT